MDRSRRIQVTVGPELGLAIDMEAERAGLAPAAMARMLVYQACVKVMNSPEFRRRLRASGAYRTAGDLEQEMEYRQFTLQHEELEG